MVTDNDFFDASEWPEIDWFNMEVDKIIFKIIENFHEKHRADFKILILLAENVERVCHDKDKAPIGLANFLKQLKNDLEAHMQKEEQILFPMIKEGKYAMVEAPINRMKNEHKDHYQNLAEISKLTHNYFIPEDACINWRQLIEGVKTLEREMKQHIDTEDNILFPRVLKNNSNDY